MTLKEFMQIMVDGGGWLLGGLLGFIVIAIINKFDPPPDHEKFWREYYARYPQAKGRK